ncbi:MAG: 30S ribosomal protein S30e [Thaumarchaeota archaeon]|jgi:small subunit ribosomal protein S30e|nr:30S ribosomal protein S30e [Candidatus Terraquivivens yellowstonensis]MCL7387463.1 30S ribosomal protein S30e [Candidatus Terraquivivens yellowstonensis]MCL7392121.1 30S ribosomal protein S30e [Candidatus Terraquivivens yellowstonensis]MCL7395083.1 30S ribosomal protein S30e [Candidatus Terraquivivens yellowstonensis]MCL7397923.1 30S ribosomal protein S30e [Candidatus Terraquivivens yellowstonensis]
MPSHGSVTKAGKVRSQTPKLEAKPRRSPVPRIRNRNNYRLRVLEAKPSEERSFQE